MRGLAVLLALILAAACSTKLGKDGRSDTTLDVKYLAKTEVDRVLDSSRAEIVAGMRRIAEKLYKRNPREWKRAGLPSREAALSRLFSGTLDFAELGGRREGAAALYAFSPDYSGDRVLAVMSGLLGMVYAAFEDKDD